MSFSPCVRLSRLGRAVIVSGRHVLRNYFEEYQKRSRAFLRGALDGQTPKDRLVARGGGGRGWNRTTDPSRVKRMLYR